MIMRWMSVRTIVIFACAALSSVPGCLGVARVSDMPKSASEIDFEKLGSEDYTAPRQIRWTSTRSDFFLYVDGSMTDEALVEGIKQTLAANGYDVAIENPTSGVVIGNRGLRPNEWSSLMALYFRRSDGSIALYIENRITQDITGGPGEDRARNFAGQLCVSLGSCSF